MNYCSNGKTVQRKAIACFYVCLLPRHDFIINFKILWRDYKSFFSVRILDKSNSGGSIWIILNRNNFTNCAKLISFEIYFSHKSFMLPALMSDNYFSSASSRFL